jgi:hypothetical protein
MLLVGGGQLVGEGPPRDGGRKRGDLVSLRGEELLGCLASVEAFERWQALGEEVFKTQEQTVEEDVSHRDQG